MHIPPFREVWAVDFEYATDANGLPCPVCLVACELVTGRKIETWLTDGAPPVPPYNIGDDTLFIAYNSPAELGCHLVLGWDLPKCVLDLYVEFRHRTNTFLPKGQPQPKASLLAALAHFGLPSIGVEEKEAMRELIISGGPWTDQQRADILAYCATDVVALQQLTPLMLPNIHIGQAVNRGRFMRAVACMNHIGIPMDPLFHKFKERWQEICQGLVAEADSAFGVYDGITMKQDRLEAYLIREDIPWPRTPTGRLRTDDDTFKDMARRYPQLNPLRELHWTLGEMERFKVTLGPDDRNRFSMFPFGTMTGRNTPKADSILGRPVWMRSFWKPPEGMAIAYLDWTAAEFGIAAALSKDPAMLSAYLSGDVYLAFAILAGAAPPGATKQSHKAIRDQFKVCSLAVLYGQGAEGLAEVLEIPTVQAAQLIQTHRLLFPVFWKWSARVVENVEIGNGKASTVAGWTAKRSAFVNDRSIMNYPMQANCAELLHLATSYATEAGVEVCLHAARCAVDPGTAGRDRSKGGRGAGIHGPSLQGASGQL